MNVLLVEDEAALADTIARNLRAREHVVRIAPTGEAAIAEIERELPDALLLDINLPDVTGWDVLRRVRPDQRARMAVIAVSAGSISPRRIEELQPDHWLEKPFPMDALVRMLAQHEVSIAQKEEL